MALSHKRVNGMAVNPLSSIEIEAWSRLHGIRMTPFEVHALEAVDAVYIEEQGKGKP